LEKIIEKFSVKYLQILDENGRCDENLKPNLTNGQIKQMYELMVLTRIFDEKALKLQRQGRLGTYASVKGQEACQIPSAMQLQQEDLIVPAFREHGVFITKGLPLEMLFQAWSGDERGMKMPNKINILPISIPVGSHPLHAVGAAMAYKFQNKKAVSVSYFGDGATSEGDVHEAMNFAGVFKAPTIFICQNNQFAISVPVKEQTASSTLAQKAIAYGFEGIQVDGNDVFAVYKATKDALQKARSNKGPTFIECFTYRITDHTTSDDASRYRKESEVKQWELKDPVERLKKYMFKKGILTEQYELEIKRNAEQKIEEAVSKMEDMVKEKPEEMFNYTYERLTPELREQKEEVKNARNEDK
jgi:pyruvate dehydrogenase E1 component alpha subunit